MLGKWIAQNVYLDPPLTFGVGMTECRGGQKLRVERLLRDRVERVVTRVVEFVALPFLEESLSKYTRH